MILDLYFDDNLLTGSDVDGIKKAKEYLKTQFVTKDIGSPRYYFGIKMIKIAHNKHRVVYFFSTEVWFGFITRD